MTNNNNNDHQDILDAIAHADKHCAPEQAPVQNAPATTKATTQQDSSLEQIGPTDKEMREIFAEREKKKFKLGLAVNGTLLAFLAAPCLAFAAWYQLSPKNQASFAELLDNFREVPNDVKSMGTMTDTYEEALSEVGAHGAAIDEATRALGVDPEQFNAEQEAKEDDNTAFLRK